jgi:hypothetical protein
MKKSFFFAVLVLTLAVPLTIYAGMTKDPILHVQEFHEISRLSPVNKALIDIFSISANQIQPEDNCANEYDNPLPEFYTKKVLSSIDGRSVEIFVYRPDDSSENVQLAEEGANIISSMFPIYERYFSPYPCNKIYIHAFDGAGHSAYAGPGFVYVGGANGVNSWTLLGHEFTHHYFHSAMSYSWLAEGAAQFLPYVNYHQQLLNGTTTLRELYGDYSSFDFTFNDFVANEMTDWAKSSIEQDGVSPDTPLCAVDSDLEKGADLGLLFMTDAYLNMGEVNYLNAMATLYERYRITKQKNTYSDIMKVFEYFTPADKQDFLKNVRIKLCQPVKVITWPHLDRTRIMIGR